MVRYKNKYKLLAGFFKRPAKKFLNKNRGKLITAIIALSAITLVFFITSSFKSAPQITKSGDEATLILTLDDLKRTFVGEVAENMTALDAIIASTRAGNLKISYAITKDNETDLKELNDHKDTAQFSFYINNRKLNSKNLNQTPIKAGDVLEVKDN